MIQDSDNDVVVLVDIHFTGHSDIAQQLDPRLAFDSGAVAAVDFVWFNGVTSM